MRTDWSRRDVSSIYSQPLLNLLFDAQSIHRQFHPANQVQMCRLLSIKTGGCPEDCAYCPQSARYETGVPREHLMNTQEIVAAATRAKADGATRFCMGAAWRQAPHGREFDSILESVSAVAGLGIEVCCTLGMLTDTQAQKLKRAGLTAYNHNLDSSPEFYSRIITTRTYQDRLDTL
ncbi:MAG: radical SAM protein, partial [Candidatus Angelobacter sp.]